MDFLPADPAKTRALKYFLILTLGMGVAAGLFTEPSIPTWYAALDRPAIAPPPFVFAPVRTALDLAMAGAAWRVWRITGLRSIEMLAFAALLFLIFAWSGIFFALHKIGPAFGAIVLLDLTALCATLLFLRRDSIAGLLMLPCLGWVLFVTILNRAFWVLNP